MANNKAQMTKENLMKNIKTQMTNYSLVKKFKRIKTDRIVIPNLIRDLEVVSYLKIF